ncbi:MAG TPA: hypothetical protein VGL77_13600 [Armatimonadota bacterium]|jgi:hypothetical protein
MKVLRYLLCTLPLVLLLCGNISHAQDAKPAAQPATAIDGVTGMKLWLKADAGVTADAQHAVSKWADQSGAGNDARAVGIEQPHCVPDAINGKPALRFDGENDNLTLGERYLFAPTGGITLLAVMKSTVEKNIPTVLSFGWAPRGYYSFQYDRKKLGVWAVPLAETAQGGAASVEHQSADAAVIYTGIIRFGASCILRLNGQKVRETSARFIPKLGAEDIAAKPLRNAGMPEKGGGGPVSIGMQSKVLDATRSFGGDIAELIWFDRGLSDDECKSVEKYLSAKYGIALQ